MATTQTLNKGPEQLPFLFHLPPLACIIFFFLGSLKADQRLWRVSTSTVLFPPCVKQVVQSYLDMTSPPHHNLDRDAFVGALQQSAHEDI
jgi:hypothetical protein